MDVSSDDSFAWTSASHVSSDTDSDSMKSTEVLNGLKSMTPKNKRTKAMEETTIETNKAKKRKINQGEPNLEENRSPKKKKIKTEILSDESSLKKSKHRIVFEKSDDETDLGVKSEELSASETSFSKPKKKKHKKHKNSETLNESEDFNDKYLNLRAKQEITTDTELNTTKVKNVKKNKKSQESFMTNGCKEESDQYLDVKVKEEPDLSDSTVKSKKKKKSKLSINSNFENEQDLDENYLDVRVKEEENSFTKKSKKKKHSIDNQPGSDIDNSTNNKPIPDELTSDPVMVSPKNKKNRKSESTSKEDDMKMQKKSKKSKKDKHSQMEEDHEDVLTSNQTSIIENYKSDKQQTPVKLNHKKNNCSTSSCSDEDRHIEIKDHIFKTPQATSKLTGKKHNSKNFSDKSLGNKFPITKNTRISDVKSSYDSSDDESPTENTRMSATNMSISPIINQTISNRKHSLSGDSSDDDHEVKQDMSSGPLTLKSPVKKRSNESISKRTVSRSDSSDKEKSPDPVLKCPQDKMQSSKTVMKRSISKDHSSESSSEEDKNKSPIPVSKSQSKKQSKRTVSKSNCSSDEESSNDERSKSPAPVTKSPSKRQASNNISKRTISDSSNKNSSVDSDNNNMSVVKSPSKNPAKNVSKRTISDSSEEDSPVEESHKSEARSPSKKQPSNNIPKKTASDDSSDGGVSNKKPVAQPKTVKNRRITDRILFEQDESDEEHDLYNTRLKQFLKTNSNLLPITQKSTSNSVITDDDEIWILKCPSDVHVKTLKNSEVLLDKKCKFKMNGETYLGSIDNDIDKVAVTSYEHNKFLIKNIPVNGVVHIKKRVPKQHLQDDSMLLPNQNHFIPLPETKCRHPFFGSNFKKAIKVPKHIEQRLKDSEDLNESKELSPEEERRQRKKLKKRLRESLKEEPMEVVTEQEVAPELRKKAKKRKHENVDKAPKKKKKKHNESSEVWDSAQAIEENLFNY